MPQGLAQHSIVAICLIITLEEANVPLPIPGDLLLVYAGAMSAHSLGRFSGWLVLLTLVPTLGAMALYALVRRGGRPLIKRYGRYLALGPRELARSEALFARYGWGGIAVGRSIPFLRHAVIIACGVLNVPWRSVLLGQLVGGAINTLIFMLLGALLGPTVIEAIHLPRQVVRLVELLLLAVGLPALLWWLCLRVRAPAGAVVTRRQLVGPILLASAAGTAALSATWAALAAASALWGPWPQLHLLIDLAQWGVGRGLPPGLAYVLVFTGLLAICAALGAAYALLLRPSVAPDARSLLRQALGLAVLAGGALALTLLVALALPHNAPMRAWWAAQPGGITLALSLGVLAYAITTVCGHTLAVALVCGR
ncbi:MAG: hypothetical protein HGA45_18850 [Chloroflexales bacterium]|nr:hypothetical protein [Chloroflexales bacterium]